MNTQRVFAIVAPAGPREKAVASFIVAQTKTFLGPPTAMVVGQSDVRPTSQWEVGLTSLCPTTIAVGGPRKAFVWATMKEATAFPLGPAGAPNAKMRWAFTAAHIATVRVTMAFRTCLLESYVTTRANGNVGTAY